MALDGQNGARGFGTLLRHLVDGCITLARDEARLVKLEAGDVAVGLGKGTAFVAMGAVLALLGVLSFVVGLVLLVGDQWLPADRYWLGALILLVITGACAAWFARRGMALLSPPRLAPQETVTTIKEDKEWLKQQLTSDATSR